MTDQSRNAVYFCDPSQPVEELGRRIHKRVRDFYQFMLDSGRTSTIQRLHDLRYSHDPDRNGNVTDRVTRAGPSGDELRLRIRHIAAIARQAAILVTSQLPEMQPMARNSDASTVAATLQAEDVLQDEMENGLRADLVSQVTQALTYSACWIGVYWDPEAGPARAAIPGVHALRPGEDYDVEPAVFPHGHEQEGQPNPNAGAPTKPRAEGAVRWKLYHALDAVIDIHRHDADHDWVITREWINRFEVAEKYPAQRERILSFAQVSTGTTGAEIGTELTTPQRHVLQSAYTPTSDIIPVLDLWHRPTPALPQGVHVRILWGGTVLGEPEPNLYEELPVYELTPDRETDTPFGHTPLQDLAAAQEAYDAAFSQALTKVAQSKPKALAPMGSNLTPEDLGGGFKLLKYNEKSGPPVVFSLEAKIEPEMALAASLERSMEGISGVNAVVRGNAEGQSSGAKAAFVQAQAILAQSGLQSAFHALLGRVGTAIIKRHQKFNDFPRRLVAAAGKTRASDVPYFLGANLKGVETVRVEAGSAVRQSSEARQTMLDKLLTVGAKLTPAQILQFWESGRLDTATDGLEEAQKQVQLENEALRQGQQVPAALITDPVQAHIQGHATVLSSLEARTNPEVLQNVMEHLQSHFDALLAGDPLKLTATGHADLIPAIMQTKMMAAGPVPASAGPPGAPPPAGPPSGPHPAGPTPVPASANGGQRMPNMPKLPTGQQADPLAQRNPLSQLTIPPQER